MFLLTLDTGGKNVVLYWTSLKTGGDEEIR